MIQLNFTVMYLFRTVFEIKQQSLWMCSVQLKWCERGKVSVSESGRESTRKCYAKLKFVAGWQVYLHPLTYANRVTHSSTRIYHFRGRCIWKTKGPVREKNLNALFLHLFDIFSSFWIQYYILHQLTRYSLNSYHTAAIELFAILVSLSLFL